MIAGCLKSVTSVNTRLAEDGAAAEDSGRVPLKSRSKLEHPRAGFITAYFIKQMIKTMRGSVHASRLSVHLCAFSLGGCVGPPWQRSKVSVRSWCGVRWKMEGEAGRGEADLLVTITIELLYKAPVDNIGGITEQDRQSGFIKKGLVGVGGRQKLHPGRDDLCELSGWGVWLCLCVGGLQPLWILLISVLISVLQVYCADMSKAPTHDRIMNMHAR